MSTDFETIVVRALNIYRKVHPASYLGLRLLLDSLQSSRFGSRLLEHKLKVREKGIFYRFNNFKKLDENGEPVYNKFLTCSPMSILFEAYILDILSKEEVFKTHPCIYSYTWSRNNKSGYLYDYFWNNYHQRNKDVTELLQKDSNQQVIVLDLKKFYPRVSQEIVFNRFNLKLEQISRVDSKNTISRFTKSMLDANIKGIPIGPPLGHLLGNISLEKVDELMVKKLGKKYLRYVDDIFIVAEKNQTDNNLKYFIEAISNEGLEINEDKYDVIDSSIWFGNNPIKYKKDDERSIHSLKNELTEYLIYNPQKYNTLRKMFLDEGFLIPFKQISANSKYGRFRHIITRFRKREYYRSRYFITYAINLRNDLLKDIDKLSKEFPEKGIRRRWLIQQYRHRLGSLLYLLSPIEYSKLLGQIPDIIELNEYNLINKALLNNNISTGYPVYSGKT